MANVTSLIGAPPSGVSIDNNRRIFNFGERVAELAPQQSPFFVYLSKVAKKATDDPVFKFLEQRHQWQRRNFAVAEAGVTGATGVVTEGSAGATQSGGFLVDCGYKADGTVAASQPPTFLLVGQVIAVQGATAVENYRINAVSTTASVSNGIGNSGSATAHRIGITDLDGSAATVTFVDDAKAQVIGSAFEEGSGAPDGWQDIMMDREGYCQIFKTGMNIFSGTAMATRYRGVADEYKRVWQEKLMEHKMDLEHAFLFGLGNAWGSDDAAAGAPMRMTHGILPYTESNGKVYNFSYASSGYDAFLDAMEDFFAPESGNSGNKLVLASRKVITYLNKLGAGSFMNNSVGSSQYSLDINSIPGAFGHQVTVVNTIFGSLHFVAEPLLRGPWEDYAVAVDMKNIAYRPLVGNGVSRDTFVETNVQGNDIDGRKDQIITEAGLEISLPETHAILKFS